jgi:subtilisin family serine protease
MLTALLRRPVWLVLLVLVRGSLVAAPPAALEDYRTFLSRDRIGAAAFTKAHPAWDGRGAVVVAVLDTGVDMTLPGLRTTSTGETKVVEARDFTGQGDVSLVRAEETVIDGRAVLQTADGYVFRPESLPEPPGDGVWWLGFLAEERFRNSAVPDVNANGQTDETFAFLVVRSGSWEAPRWTVYPDRDGDRDLTDEAPLHDYLLDRAVFTFDGADPTRKTAPLSFAPTVVAAHHEAPRLSLHFVDGSHGSHVAGIAAGHAIGGIAGFDGIAPGARVLSLKIGDNTLAGGSTTTESMKKALEYAGEWTRRHGDVVVVNLSYGVGSEIEGDHEIDRLVDALVPKYPRLVIATSAGNAGPGLSTVGTPAGARLAFAVGALLTPANARDLYGAKLAQEQLFAFSSRGGELDKPDAVAPGVAWSTVPDWEPWQIFRGTSMASPQAAGAMALLVSAALAQSPPLDLHAGLVHRALRYTARPLKDVPSLAQGGGVIDVPAAWEAFARFAKRGEARGPVGYDLSTAVPTQPDGDAPAAYWRTGGYVPAPPLQQVFHVKALLPHTLSPAEREEFQAVYDLRADVPWIDVDRGSVGLRGDLVTDVAVTYDPDRLRAPGLYTGRVVATPRTASSARVDTAFELVTTVIVPERLDRAREHVLRAPKTDVPFGTIARWFVLAPPGASTLDVRVAPTRGDFAYVQLAVFDPAGQMLPVSDRDADSERGLVAHATVPAQRLRPGATYEVVVYADYRRYGASGRTSTVDVEIRFGGVRMRGPDLTFAPGEAPSGTVTFLNAFDQPFLGRAQARIDGVQHTDTVTVEGDTWEQGFSLGGPHVGVLFELEMSPEAYGRFTDVALDILDAQGASVAQSGFSEARATIGLPRGRGSYTLRLKGGLARAGGDSIEVRLTERYLYADPIPLELTSGGAPVFALYPGVEADLSVAAASVPPQAPDGFAQTGTVRLVPSKAPPEVRWFEQRFTVSASPADEPEASVELGEVEP